MERTFKTVLNFPSLKAGSDLTLDEAKKYFNVYYALASGWIVETTDDHLFLDFSEPDDLTAKRLHIGDLAFYVTLSNPIISGSFDLTKSFFETPLDKNIRLFYDEDSQREFILEELDERIRKQLWIKRSECKGCDDNAPNNKHTYVSNWDSRTKKNPYQPGTVNFERFDLGYPAIEEEQTSVGAESPVEHQKRFSLSDIISFIKDAPHNNGSPFARKFENDIINNAVFHLV